MGCPRFVAPEPSCEVAFSSDVNGRLFVIVTTFVSYPIFAQITDKVVLGP